MANQIKRKRVDSRWRTRRNSGQQGGQLANKTQRKKLGKNKQTNKQTKQKRANTTTAAAKKKTNERSSGSSAALIEVIFSIKLERKKKLGTTRSTLFEKIGTLQSMAKHLMKQ